MEAIHFSSKDRRSLWTGFVSTNLCKPPWHLSVKTKISILLTVAQVGVCIRSWINICWMSWVKEWMKAKFAIHGYHSAVCNAISWNSKLPWQRDPLPLYSILTLPSGILHVEKGSKAWIWKHLSHGAGPLQGETEGPVTNLTGSVGPILW